MSRCAALLIVVVAAGCIPSAPAVVRCTTDQDCASSFACVEGRCASRGDEIVLDASSLDDRGDGGDVAASLADAGSADASAPDAGADDAGGGDDAGLSDDGGAPDAGALDAGAPDAGALDAGALDAGALDAGALDAGIPDGGTTCGDEAVDISEACDDGNRQDRDGCSSSCQLWWDDSFAWRVPVTLQNPTSAVDDFPLLLSVPRSLLEQDAIGDTVCFVDDDHATELPWELDSVDESLVRVWVRVPRIDSGADRLWFYGGYAGGEVDPCGVPSSETWSRYRAVWHMNDDLDDATGSGVDLTNYGTTEEAGQIGPSRLCSPTNNYRLRHDGNQHLLLRGDVTLEAWVWLDALSGGYYGNQFIIMTDDAVDLEDPAVNVLYSLRYDAGNGIVTYWEHDVGVDVDPVTGPFTVATGGWHHYAVTRDATAKKVRFYFDGLPVGSVQDYPNNPTAGDFSRLVVCGHPQFPERNLEGRIDEVRIATDVKPAAWMRLVVMSAKGTLATVGTLEGP